MSAALRSRKRSLKRRPPSALLRAVDACRNEMMLPRWIQEAIASDTSGETPLHHLARLTHGGGPLAARLLAWSNSPLFNLSRRFTRLEQVRAVLGDSQTMRLAILASIRGLFQPDRQIRTYQRQQLWRHSMAVGAVAALVARVSGRVDPAGAWLAGAVHDIGLLAGEIADPAGFADLLDQLDAVTDTASAQRHRTGYDHQQLGAEVLCRWGFERRICDVARLHHHPHLAGEAADAALTDCVILADYLCSRCGWTELGLHNVAQPPDSVFQRLRIDQAALAIIWQQLYATLEHTRVLI
ncbi:HDOD domain-containing protein [Roseimaritima sediminicola]|uniref:HDOD domain-containing protein n=1 Tax=Roseimaritima sediminicola TaxID=2662066 RepID=UPI0012982C5F|nr:HDOD domain-containing protein [Roseimaritima sediminicola]